MPIKKVSLGKVIQGRFRERREHMELKFTGTQIFFLNAVIRQPGQFLPLAEAGMTLPTGQPQPFKVGPKDRKRLISLKNWIESLMEWNEDKKQFDFPKEDEVIATRLTKSYIEFLRDMIVFYERVGSLVQWCEVYENTLAILDGKDPEAGIDSLEEMMGPEDSKKEDKKPDPVPELAPAPESTKKEEKTA